MVVSRLVPEICFSSNRRFARNVSKVFDTICVLRIDGSQDKKKRDCPGDLIPEVRLLWTTGVTGEKVQTQIQRRRPEALSKAFLLNRINHLVGLK